MAHKFCDSVLITGANNGLTMDDAWQSIETAIENNGLGPGDIIWIRRRSSFIATTSSIMGTRDGTQISPIRCLGCPRNVLTGTITFTNGSNVLSASSITPDFEKHLTRRIKKDADGRFYMITALAHKINYDAETGAFTEGLMVTSSGTGVGKIHRLVDEGTTGTLWIVVKSGTFGDDETITDEDTGSATVNGNGADDGFIIDREYAGSTAVEGAFTIEKDDDYDLFQTIDDSGWTIKKADWNADADDLSLIDFNSVDTWDFAMSNQWWWVIKNLIFRDSMNNYGLMQISGVKNVLFQNCIAIQTNNKKNVNISSNYSALFFSRCIFMGSGTGSGQHAFYAQYSCALYLKDCAIYNMGGRAYYSYVAPIPFFDNVNMGIELPNAYEEIYVLEASRIVGKDLHLGGKNGLFGITGNICSVVGISVENYGKVEGAHWRMYYNGTMINKAVVTGSGDPYKRSGGADSVIDVVSDIASTRISGVDEWKYIIFEHEYEMGIVSKSYRYYVQCKDMAITDAKDLYIEAEYVDQYDDASEYHLKKVRSDETITQRTGVDDWSQYIEVTGIEPATASKVRIKCLLSKYDANGHIFIDPKVVIT